MYVTDELKFLPSSSKGVHTLGEFLRNTTLWKLNKMLSYYSIDFKKPINTFTVSFYMHEESNMNRLALR